MYHQTTGMLIKQDQIPTIKAKELTVLKGPEDIQFHQLPRKIDKENMPIQCTNDGCTDEFANEKELLRHQFVGKCHFEMEFKSSANSDITKKKYFEKLSESAFLRGVLNLSTETKESAGEQNNMTIDWALKTERKCKRFTRTKTISWLTNLILASKLVGKKTFSMYLKACCM